MPINSFDPTHGQHYLSYLIDTLCKTLREQKMPFVLAVQYPNSEIFLGHYSAPVETHEAIRRAIAKLEAA
jgi:hypothetical protein